MSMTSSTERDILRIARDLLVKINQAGVPAGSEFLDTISPQYISNPPRGTYEAVAKALNMQPAVVGSEERRCRERV